MLSLGIDAGTKSFKTCLMRNGKKELKSLSSNKAFQYLVSVRKKYPSIPIVLPSGFGIPLTEACRLTDRDIFEMTLKKEDTNIVGLGKFLQKATQLKNAYCIPSVKLLPTVPRYRKYNKIDMGTSDKLCSVAFILSILSKKENLRTIDFIMCEVGWGFTSLVVVKGGKVVDGMGGTQMLGALCRGTIDGELAYLHDFSKKDIYSGGYIHIEKRGGEGRRAFTEELEKKILGLKEYYHIDRLIVSGRRKHEVGRMISRSQTLTSEHEGYEASMGAALIADGICGGRNKRIVSHLAITRVTERMTDWIYNLSNVF